MSDDLTTLARETAHTVGHTAVDMEHATRLVLAAINVALTAERQAREQAEQERDRAKAVLAEVVEWFGPWHGDSCPCDDTCACEVKPLNDRINAVLAALSPQDTPR
jgi:hypothetical protein